MRFFCAPALLRPATQFRGPILFRVLALLCLLCAPLICAAQVKRLVVVKLDGLPHDEVDQYVRETDPRTGKSRLPWIEHIFYQRGTRLTNFYVRGMSLSAPSWSLLDTGQHLQVKGNVEYDRWTLRAYDYLNFIPFYLNNVIQRRVDMPGPEALDQLGIPLLMDAFPYERRQASFQLFQRGVRWSTLQRGLQNRFTTRTPAELLDEWVMGIEARQIVQEQFERELVEKLADPQIQYLDYYDTHFDHTAHHNGDRESHLRSLLHLDATIGRIWTQIQRTSLAPETVFVLVSDHGTNSVNGIYSQGFNMVKLLGSAAGGGHHVITKRRPLLDYSIKGIYPLVPLITTTTSESKYLRGASTAYPTALLDFDGNERVAIHLRDNDLNQLHLLLQQLQRPELAGPTRRAAADAFFSIVERRRPGWSQAATEVAEELQALRGAITQIEQKIAAVPRKWTQQDRDLGRHEEAIRLTASLTTWRNEERQYTQYLRSLNNLLALQPASFDPPKIKVGDLIPERSMGDANTIYGLENYVVGLSEQGLTVRADGSLDFEKSFERINYLRLIHDVAVRNNVQPRVGPRPVDFIALYVTRAALRDALPDGDLPDEEAVWLYGGEDAQALILSRRDDSGQLWLKYLPVARLKQRGENSEALTFEKGDWRAGLPLKIFEDAALNLPPATKDDWLRAWHTDREWLSALAPTKYSNGLIGLHEQFARHTVEMIDPDAAGIDKNERVLRRLRLRQRRLIEADFLVFANDHWNFDVRGFNPGGNHGSFFRISTHSTLMFAGGERTGIPVGQTVDRPYDSLSFAPTLLTMMKLMHSGQPSAELRQRGFRPMPGPVIAELLPDRHESKSSPGTSRVGDRR